jgi:dihydroorotate dehydrogenase
MLTLSNSYRFEFAAAAGALGLDGDDAGNGIVRLWKWPFKRLGILRTRDFTVITKTLTFAPRRGNLRWWCPWRAVRRLGGDMGLPSVINAVGLTNPGLYVWADTYLRRLAGAGRPVIVSLAPENPEEAESMARRLQWHNAVVGIELNLSCPNSGTAAQVNQAVEMVQAVKSTCHLPIILKLGIAQPYLDICRTLDGRVDAFDLINAVPWRTISQVVYGKEVPSPLAGYGLQGAVSGDLILTYARAALAAVRGAEVQTPILSGGGIRTIQEIDYRFNAGASAVSLGVAFMRPWLPSRLVRQWRRLQELKSYQPPK